MKEFIFYYFMKDEKELIQKSVPKHASYWHNLKLSGGPFNDFSGGFVCFHAKNQQDAQSIVNSDPFVIDNLLSQQWIKEWLNK